MGIKVDIKKKLGDFTLDIKFESDAARIGILGASGCGKSLTLKSIAGIERPDSGSIQIGEKVLFDSESRINLKPQKRNVGYMFQNYALFPTMTVEQNIAAGLDRGFKEKDERVADMIERFSLRGLEKHLPGQLSGGQQQRVALARIMAYSPDIIMLDEPYSALDQHLKERLQHEMLGMLQDYRGQVIMVSHNRDEIYRFGEDLLIMEEGKISASGRTTELFDDPGSISVARMTGCKNIVEAEKVEERRIRIPKWDVEISLSRSVPEDIHAIGYRAHFFEPVWGEREENCIPFNVSGFDELPFERRYYIHPAGDDPGADLICWFIQDNERRRIDEGAKPDYLKLREDAIMMLKKD